ncbi:MAG: CidA/LrgA family protein [Rhodobacteraceae bacterium]|nr:CidA/LrgA family protein [Paracoccaceae bacterium]
MLHALTALLLCQLVGEAATRSLSLPLPGPVLGLVLMLALLVSFPRFAALMRPVAQGILAHLSLLFVPAGVGVVGHLATLGGQTMALMLAVVGSTVLSIAAGAVTFAAVARLTGARDD